MDDVRQPVSLKGDPCVCLRVVPSVEVKLVYTCGQGSHDVSVEVVTDHKGGLTRGSCLLEGVLEEEWVGLVVSCVLAEYDFLEISKGV